MKATRIAIASLLLLMLSSVVLLATVKAASWPMLPTTQVQLTVVDGTTSYWVSTLSGVPAGFDVHNGAYPGWCTDRSTNMTRSVSHNVVLYSSLAPPPTVSGINWVAINYILNHKQGSMMDVQQAIWHLTGWWNFENLTPTAQTLVNEANTNPSYDPLTGAVLAVICLPQDGPGVQNSILGVRATMVGGYTTLINIQNIETPGVYYGMLVAILVGAFAVVRRKTDPKK